MPRFTTLCERPACFRTFTGLSVEEFTRLASRIHTNWLIQGEEHLANTGRSRKRKEGGGRKPELKTLEDQLLLTLAWSRLYPVYLVLEFLFGIDESTVSRTIQHIRPLLQDQFIPSGSRKKIKSLEELKKFLPPDINSMIFW